MDRELMIRIERVKLEFALALHKRIVNHGLLQKEVAAKAGFSAAYLSRVLRGDENLTIATASKIADAAGMDFSIVTHPYQDEVKKLLFELQIAPESVAWRKDARLSEAFDNLVAALESHNLAHAE